MRRAAIALVKVLCTASDSSIGEKGSRKGKPLKQGGALARFNDWERGRGEREGKERWRREEKRWEDDLIGWGGQGLEGLEGRSRATGMAGLYGRANLPLWGVRGCRECPDWIMEGLGGAQGVEGNVSV